MRFLEPCLLLLLTDGEAHGYSLQEGLARFGFDPGSLDPSLTYRALRGMQSAGWVTSRESVQSQGPPRRVYRLTERGRRGLDRWVEDLRTTRAEIDSFLEAYAKRCGGRGASSRPVKDEESLR